MEALDPHKEISRYGPLAKLTVEVEARTVTGVRMVDGVVWLANEQKPVRVKAETALFDPDGVECMTVASLSTAALNDSTATGIYQAAELGHTRLTFTIEDPEANRTADGLTFPPSVRFLSDGSLHKVKTMTVLWEVTISQEAVALEHGAIRGTPFAYGKVEVAGHETLVVVAGEQLDEALTESEAIGHPDV